MMVSQTPWRRGIGNECQKVFDGQGSVVADHVGTSDGNLIAAAPDLRQALLDLCHYFDGGIRPLDARPLFDAADKAIIKSR
jgi:hypothetical protein